jgi:two-component system sensor histidine kinase/response regulator
MSNDDNFLDRAALANLRDVVGGDNSVLAELVSTFLEEAPLLLGRLHEGVAGGSAAMIRLNAHSLKGNAADFGALALAELCLQMEKLGRSGEVHGAHALLTAIEAEYRHVEAALGRLLNTLR